MREEQHKEVDAWFILREALIEGKYSVEYVHLHEIEWIMNSYTVSAWNKKTGEHEPGFLLDIFDTRLGTSRYLVITQALMRPGTDRPFNDMQRDAWIRESVDQSTLGDDSSPISGDSFEGVAAGSNEGSSMIDIGASSQSTGYSEHSEDDPVQDVQQVEPLWCLVLSMQEYLRWGRPGVLNTEAERQFRIVLDQRAVAVGLWEIFSDAEFDLPLRDVHLNETQILLEAKFALVGHEDGTFRRLYPVLGDGR